MADDLSALFPDRELTLSGGQALAIRPLYFGQLPKAIKLLRPIIDAVRGTGIASFDGGNLALAPDWPLRLPQLMDEGGEALIEFVGFAIGKPRDWFDMLGADDGIAITKSVFEANGSFFAQRVAPMLGFVQTASPAPAGEPSPPVSVDTDTPGTTSSA